MSLIPLEHEFNEYALKTIKPETLKAYSRHIRVFLFKNSYSLEDLLDDPTPLIEERARLSSRKSTEKEAKSALNKLIEFINLKNGKKIKLKRSLPSEIQQKMKIYSTIPPQLSNDIDSYENVRYASNVSGEERVEGLCEFVAKEYKSIFTLYTDIFGWFDVPFSSIEIILSKEEKTTTYKNDVVNWLKHEIEIYGKKLSKKRIKTIIDSQYTQFKIDGEYYHSSLLERERKPRIVIYYKAIDAKDIKSYFINVSRVLAHEVAHYIHDSYIGFSQLDSMDFNVKIIKESIADFASILYLVNRKQNLGNIMEQCVKQRYELWSIHLGSSWEYANSIYFTYIDKTFLRLEKLISGAIIDPILYKFRDVFNTSKTSITEALEKLYE